VQVKIITGHKIVIFYKVENIKQKKILAADYAIYLCGTNGIF